VPFDRSGVKRVRIERRFHTRAVHIDRRKGDDDVIEHVIRGIQRVYVQAADRVTRQRPGS